MKMQIQILKFNGNIINMPYVHLKGREEGPAAFIVSGMHGNEITGILLVKSFLEWAEKVKIESKLKGEIYIVPVANISGFNQMKRVVVEDGKDLNRSFGIERAATYSEELAQKLVKEFFSKCDFGLDLHDSGQELIMLPHTRVHECEPNKCMTMTHTLAKYFDRKITVERKGESDMLAVHMAEKYQISVLTIETGSTENAFVMKNNTSLNGLINILIGMGMYPGKLKLKNSQIVLKDRFNITNRKAGYVKFTKKPGDIVHAGDTIGEIYYPLVHSFEKIKNPKCGMLFTLWKEYQIREGAEFFSVLDTMNCNKKHKINEEDFESITIEKKKM